MNNNLRKANLILLNALEPFKELDRDGTHTESIMGKMERSVEAGTVTDMFELLKLMELAVLDRLNMGYANWSRVAASILSTRIRMEKNRTFGKEVSFFETLYFNVEAGLTDKALIEKYSKKDIEFFDSKINHDLDKLFKYDGLTLLSSRYLVHDHDKNIVELPQERFMTIAMVLMQDEYKDRKKHVVEAYWAMSNLYMTTATPTLSNAGKTHGQLSSCFIDTVNDSLRDIYDSNTDTADLSKYGGGIGLYMGKVRSKGSDIQGFKNVSSGVLPWIKQLNNTAVSVDQLGQRQGAIAVYLDVWHKDIQGFLKMQTNSGSERLKAQDIFSGACIPDIFMEAVDAREPWYLFDPHEVSTKMGINLEDHYDEERGNGSFRNLYYDIVNNHPEISRIEIPAIEIMKDIMLSQLETGLPYMFYRDEVNRQNANDHAGMIYSSNLCTEITQNMSSTTYESSTLIDDNGDPMIITKRRPGDFVVCNLSSINLARAYSDDVLERLIKIQVRMLDNVIDINTQPLEQAKWTNQRYRAIGLGTFGWHQVLAEAHIHWESDESIAFADKIYEKIAYLTIQSSSNLAAEKGEYPLFKGSRWQTGQYIEDKYANYNSPNGFDWNELNKQIQHNGIRNSYLMAVAPNSSTAIIAGSTAGIDPIFDLEYNEEKKDMTIPVVAAGLTPETFPYYQKTGFLIDQNWSIKQNEARQYHIDQAVSFNIYLPYQVKASTILDYHMEAWRRHLKTTYYTRSTTVEQKVCESCAS